MTTSNAELLRAITDLHITVGDARQAIGRLEGKLEPVLGPDGLDSRMRTVEGRQHRVAGAYGLAGALLSFVGIKIFGAH